MAGFGVEAIHAALRSHVKQAHSVLHDAKDVVAAEAARLVIDIEMRMRRGRLADQRQPAASGAYPETPPQIGRASWRARRPTPPRRLRRLSRDAPDGRQTGCG